MSNWVFSCQLGLSQDGCDKYILDPQSRGANKFAGCASCIHREPHNAETRQAEGAYKLAAEDVVKFTLRIGRDLAGALDVRAGQAGVSRHELIVNILQDEVGESGLILGRWQVHGCEIDECADCHQALDPDNTWLGATVDGRLFGPLCGSCARDD